MAIEEGTIRYTIGHQERLTVWCFLPGKDTAKTVTGACQAFSSSKYYDPSSSAFDNASFTTFTLTAHDATNWPGLYKYSMAASAISQNDAIKGFLFQVNEATTSHHEYGFIYPALEVGDVPAIADGVWDEPLSGHTSSGTTGEKLDDALDATEGEIADAVWDEALSGHTTGGTAGKVLTDAQTGAANDYSAEIADAVWDEALAGHQGAGTAGKHLEDADATIAASAVADAVWDEALSGHSVSGSAGDELRRTSALRQNNMRVKYTAWNTAGVPTAGTLYIYASKADADADSSITGASSIGQYGFTATFDGSNIIQNYLATRVA